MSPPSPPTQAQFNLLSSTMDQMSSRAAPASPYTPEHAASVPTHSPYAQPSSTFDTMSPAPVIPSNTDYPGPHHFEVTFQQSSTAKSATWTVSCPCAPRCVAGRWWALTWGGGDHIHLGTSVAGPRRRGVGQEAGPAGQSGHAHCLNTGQGQLAARGVPEGSRAPPPLGRCPAGQPGPSVPNGSPGFYPLL